jgi:hypothetical protein
MIQKANFFPVSSRFLKLPITIKGSYIVLYPADFFLICIYFFLST